MGRLVTCGLCEGLAEVSEKAHPIRADICLKVSEPSPSCFGCFLEATSPDKGIGQLDKAFPDHLPISEIDVNFERFTQVDKCRVPSFKTSLGHRKARQQVSPFSQVNGALIRQGGPETAPRFLKCCSLECVLAGQR